MQVEKSLEIRTFLKSSENHLNHLLFRIFWSTTEVQGRQKLPVAEYMKKLSSPMEMCLSQGRTGAAVLAA
jgi:hypothetical protein